MAKKAAKAAKKSGRDYGSKGQTWHPDFITYMQSIVDHAAYQGMPDAVKADGKIQWEAPSNRGSGQYQHTHERRRDWWRSKAEALGIDPTGATWISDAAKQIHPTKQKPCKRCGRVLRLAYVYPSGHLVRRLGTMFPDFKVDALEEVGALVQRLVDQCGPEVLDRFPELFSTPENVVDEAHDSVADWIEWLEQEYIPAEPSLLSPGAMSNAPDRFDGFHSFNRCCRGKADTGRHAKNMRTYGTDRRVFEYWSDGDWIAADRMMGLVCSDFRDHRCADGGRGPATADHIGPLSLGFMHRPEFRLLSRAANSAKNNRMTLWDVRSLLQTEAGGAPVASWHAAPLWRLRGPSVRNDETALRLSKLLRDNQRNAMALLCHVKEHGHLAFLASLLHLGYSDYQVEFEDLRINAAFVTTFRHMRKSPRTTKYAMEQKTRRLRIAFFALQGYGSKANRHAYLVDDSDVRAHVTSAIRALAAQPNALAALDRDLESALSRGDSTSDAELATLVARMPNGNVRAFDLAKGSLTAAMEHIAEVLSARWEDNRYVRGRFKFDDA